MSKKYSKTKPIYFDNACVSLKPDVVIDAISTYYREHPSCHKRSVHSFGQETTKKVDQSREFIKNFLNTPIDSSIIFTKNTTDSINLLAQTLDFKKGDRVLTTDLEHNSNMLPWQFLAVKKEILFEQIGIAPDEEHFNLDNYRLFLKTKKVRLVSIFHISNITGMELPIKEMVEIAHEYGAMVFLDAAQSMAHHKIDVQKLNIDFLAFSSQKVFGPSGLGILYAKNKFLEKMIPVNVGGEGVQDATYNSCTLSSIPERFEVGLQNYAGIIGTHAALEYWSKIDSLKSHEHISTLNECITEGLKENSKVQILGPTDSARRNGIINFYIKGRDSAEIALMLSKAAHIMLRSGVHCGHSWFNKYKLMPSIRVSLSFYNTREEAELLISLIRKLLV